MPVTILPVRSPSVASIQPLPSVQPLGSSTTGSTPGNQASSFSDLISNGIDTVERAQQNAVSAAQRFLSGDNEDLHTVAIAEQKAEITSDLFLQLRNKAVSAYQEVMKMQL